VCRRYIEEYELIRALTVIVGGELDWIASVSYVQEFNALDDATGIDI
jgi:hypothetical protein